jgi:hypothetical protein
MLPSLENFARLKYAMYLPPPTTSISHQLKAKWEYLVACLYVQGEEKKGQLICTLTWALYQEGDLVDSQTLAYMSKELY